MGSLPRKILLQGCLSITLLGSAAAAAPYLSSLYWNLWWIDAVTPSPGAAKYSFATVDTATQQVLDHHIHRETFYERACLQMAFEYQHADRCPLILQTGLSLFPTSWRLSFLYGYINTHFLHQPSQGAYYYRLAAQHPEAPLFVHTLGKSPSHVSR